jgi:hypothetical protein
VAQDWPFAMMAVMRGDIEFKGLHHPLRVYEVMEGAEAA